MDSSRLETPRGVQGTFWQVPETRTEVLLVIQVQPQTQRLPPLYSAGLTMPGLLPPGPAQPSVLYSCLLLWYHGVCSLDTKIT